MDDIFKGLDDNTTYKKILSEIREDDSTNKAINTMSRALLVLAEHLKFIKDEEYTDNTIRIITKHLEEIKNNVHRQI